MSNSEMDLAAHRETYASFLKMLTYVSVGVIVVLSLLAIVTLN